MLSIVFALVGLVVLALFFILRKKQPMAEVKIIQEQKMEAGKKELGEIQVLFGSQTGTAAKMAGNFAQEAREHGFEGVVIDLKNISHNEFKKNQISVFFMSNTGEGEAPENCVQFMKMVQKKADLEDQKPAWKNMNYAVFGLGDTQYQHFNKIGIDTDKGLQKLGAHRIHKIFLGDTNGSLQDDYTEWAPELWPKLVQFRQAHPYTSHHSIRKLSQQQAHPLPDTKKYLHDEKPTYANYRICIIPQKIPEKNINIEQLDFKTKASLLGKKSGVVDIIEKRQDTKNGSSLELQVVLQGHPEYQTAGNIALWPQNDPVIIKQILQYFKLDGGTAIQLQIINIDKRNKFNFITPITIQQMLQNYLDLQFRVTKGLLKKLSKFQSDSSEYFLSNSSAKTTQQYKRLSENQFCYLFKLIKKFNVKITFEDFVQLSDSVGPRLFTIASSWKAQKNVVIIASIADDGLISKHFIRNPKEIKAEIRRSSFIDIMKWKKVIFIGAGTGFAPFRGFFQQKQLAMKEGKDTPFITLYFGCKYQNSDFIYRQAIKQWQNNKVINKLSLAFSRQTKQKVYVQNVLAQDTDEIRQFVKEPECAVYLCGSVGMGKDVMKVFEEYLQKDGVSHDECKKILAGWEDSKKLIKQLW